MAICDLTQGLHIPDEKVESQHICLPVLGTCGDQKTLLTCVLLLKPVFWDDGTLNVTITLAYETGSPEVPSVILQTKSSELSFNTPCFTFSSQSFSCPWDISIHDDSAVICLLLQGFGRLLGNDINSYFSITYYLTCLIRLIVILLYSYILCVSVLDKDVKSHLNYPESQVLTT